MPWNRRKNSFPNQKICFTHNMQKTAEFSAVFSLFAPQRYLLTAQHDRERWLLPPALSGHPPLHGRGHGLGCNYFKIIMLQAGFPCAARPDLRTLAPQRGELPRLYNMRALINRGKWGWPLKLTKNRSARNGARFL